MQYFMYKICAILLNYYCTTVLNYSFTRIFSIRLIVIVEIKMQSL